MRSRLRARTGSPRSRQPASRRYYLVSSNLRLENAVTRRPFRITSRGFRLVSSAARPRERVSANPAKSPRRWGRVAGSRDTDFKRWPLLAHADAISIAAPTSFTEVKDHLNGHVFARGWFTSRESSGSARTGLRVLSGASLTKRQGVDDRAEARGTREGLRTGADSWPAANSITSTTAAVNRMRVERSTSP